MQSDSGEMHAEVRQRVALGRIIGESAAFREVKRLIPIVAQSDVAVLICGETGTGKELVARAVHYLSPRADEAFVPVNCGAIPADLVESELFGHERGAFTGATQASDGLVTEAQHGTLFLDEIDTLPPKSQVKLLRFLQDGEYRRVGSSQLKTGDARVLAATNADVEEAVARGDLRRDLYYRLNVVPLHIPPLRDRPEDIPLLAQHFLERACRGDSKTVKELSAGMAAALLEHDWPGNVRELEHVIQRAVVLSENRPEVRQADAMLKTGERPLSFRDAKARVVERFEKHYLEGALAAHNGNVSQAAQASDKNRRAFWELLRKHDIDAARFKRR